MDYLAVIRVGFGSSCGRASSKKKAISIARHYAGDWGFKPEHPLRVELYEVTGHGDLSWDDTPGIVFDTNTNKRIKKLETITA